MSIDTQLCALEESISFSVENDMPVPSATARQWMGEVTNARHQFGELAAALQQIANVNAALTLMVQLLDAAHTETIDADRMMCLIEPLREQLNQAVDDVRSAI